MKYYSASLLYLIIFSHCSITLASTSQYPKVVSLKKAIPNKQQTDLSTTEDTPLVMTPEEFNRKHMSKEEMELFKKHISTIGKQITAELKQKNMNGLDIMSKSSLIGFWSDNINLQNATGISKDWFKKVSAQLMKLGNYKNAMEVSEEHNKFELYKDYSDQYDQQLEIYLKLIRAPEQAKINEIETE